MYVNIRLLDAESLAYCAERQGCFEPFLQPVVVHIALSKHGVDCCLLCQVMCCCLYQVSSSMLIPIIAGKVGAQSRLQLLNVNREMTSCDLMNFEVSTVAA